VITSQHLLGTGLPVGVAVQSDQCLREVRGLVAAAADTQSFDQLDQDRVACAAGEMASCLLRHSTSGRIFVRLVARGDHCGVELLATDLCPGSDELGGRQAIQEIASVSDVFDHFSVPGRGTVMMSRLWGGGLVAATNPRFQIGSMIEPINGEEVSGDAWATEQSGTRLVALVVDGLGHGAAAALAAAAAVKTFRESHEEPVEAIAGQIHSALRGTRGAAIAVAEISPDAGQIRFCGIGNISARLLVSDRHKNLISQYGIAGYQARRIRAYEDQWADGATLVMHSDGLSPAWDFDDYPAILSHHPQLAASTVMRDAPRATDDALVLALRDGDATVAVATREGPDG
jgi:anti-sigma regulatory factor (Ser/Thr protein kinase)